MDNNRGIYIFIGPPFSGKETQTTPLSQELEIPVFSMGALIRDARNTDQAIENAFQQYTKKGLHVPTDIKFGLLKKEMDQATNGFILDNFPATPEDLEALNKYLAENNLSVNKVFYLDISYNEMVNRFEGNPDRGRDDDTVDALQTRSEIQSKEREEVLKYFRSQGKLVEIDGERSIEAVRNEIQQKIYGYNRR